MNREQYLQQLQLCLSHRYAGAELERLMAYYEAYFDEGGPQREAEIIQELGDPQGLARHIAGGSSTAEVVELDDVPRRGGLGRVWRVLLAICAAPIAIPLILALVLVAVTLVAATVILMVAVGGAGVVCIGAGIFAAVCGLGAVLAKGAATTIFFVGSGFVAAGIGVLLLVGAVCLAGLCLRGTAWLLGRALRRGEAQYE